MAETWLLILILAGKRGSPTTTTIEFNSNEQCLAAAKSFAEYIESNKELLHSFVLSIKK